MKHKDFEIHQLIANFLAKFSNAYVALNIGNQRKTHELIADRFRISSQSFQLLRSEYDGFYENRKGLPNPYQRKSRVEFKGKFDQMDFDTYLKEVQKKLAN